METIVHLNYVFFVLLKLGHLCSLQKRMRWYSISLNLTFECCSNYVITYNTDKLQAIAITWRYAQSTSFAIKNTNGKVDIFYLKMSILFKNQSSHVSQAIGSIRLSIASGWVRSIRIKHIIVVHTD